MSLKSSVRVLSRKLIRKKQTLGIAESCTGGLLASAITELPGVSKYFQGGLVSYANRTKIDLLKVRGSTLRKFGAVSEQTARQMARGARKAFRSDWAVSITGIAGPSGGTKSKPVGLVFCAVVGPQVEVVEMRIFRGTRKKIQQSAAEKSVALLLRYLQ